jgi:hypothetical protein
LQTEIKSEVKKNKKRRTWATSPLPIRKKKRKHMDVVEESWGEGGSSWGQILFDAFCVRYELTHTLFLPLLRVSFFIGPSPFYSFTLSSPSAMPTTSRSHPAPAAAAGWWALLPFSSHAQEARRDAISPPHLVGELHLPLLCLPRRRMNEDSGSHLRPRWIFLGFPGLRSGSIAAICDWF